MYMNEPEWHDTVTLLIPIYVYMYSIDLYVPLAV